MRACGRVVSASGGLAAAVLPAAFIGAGVRIRTSRREVAGAVVALERGLARIAVHDTLDGIAAGDCVFSDPRALYAPLGTAVLGRAMDAFGSALDARGSIRARRCAVTIVAPAASQRTALAQPFWTGVRAVDGLLTLAQGARAGIFGAPGAGKSSLLHAIVRGASADAVVLALVGERGREAEEWIRLAPPHATVVCATSDRPAIERVRCAEVAMMQASHLRKHGLRVLLVVDSIARYAGALREIALAAGEPVGRGGYPASVFSQLARYVEVAGATDDGSVTFLASVLSDGDSRDPVSDAVRSLLDGHIELSVARASEGRYPAVDVLPSTSRTMHGAVSGKHREDAALVRCAIAALARSADARAVGLAPPSEAEPAVEAFLTQGQRPSTPQATLSALAELADTLR